MDDLIEIIAVAVVFVFIFLALIPRFFSSSGRRGRPGRWL